MGFFLQIILALLCCCSLCGGAPTVPPAAPPASTVTSVKVGFYNRTCPRAEDIIRAQVQKRFLIDKSITPALLRMLFHDSFVRGADASILLDSTPGHEAEKEALPNLTIRGFDLINEAKDAVELACPGVVSCADIIVMAVRDSVALAGGPRYEVPTGRLDGKVSVKEEALNLPSPAFPVEQSQESFRQKGLDLEDMVALLGAHTVGVALCGFFNDRLFNFHGTGAADPTMNPQLVTRLSSVCPNPFFTESNADPPINLDQSTPALFDAAYYSQILAGNGILQIDQEITADPTTAGLVQSFTTTTAFFPAFIRSIIKMGNIGVITGNSPLGEIRRKCNVSNSGASARPPTPTAPPVGGVNKPPSSTHPAPVTKKPAPGAGHVTRAPPMAKPGSPGHISKSPPAPGGHATKPPVRAPGKKPAPSGHVNKPPQSPAVRPFPPGHVSKPPQTPTVKPPPSGHVRRGKTPGPTGHVSTPPHTPTVKPAPTGHVSPPAVHAPVVKPAPQGHGSVPPPHIPAAKPAPPGHVSVLTPTTKPTPAGHVSKPSPPSGAGSHVIKPVPTTPSL